MVARVLWEHLELVQIQQLRPEAVYRSVRYTKNLGVALRVDYKVSAHILENGVIGNTRGFEPLIISSKLVSPTNNMVT